MLTTDEVKQLFDYDPESGNLLYRKNQRGRGGKKAGDPAGTRTKKHDPQSAKVVMIKGKRYQVHRLVWLWHGKELPATVTESVMPINGDKSDTRIENLHIVPHYQTIIDGCRKHDDEVELGDDGLPVWLS